MDTNPLDTKLSFIQHQENLMTHTERIYLLIAILIVLFHLGSLITLLSGFLGWLIAPPLLGFNTHRHRGIPSVAGVILGPLMLGWFAAIIYSIMTIRKVINIYKLRSLYLEACDEYLEALYGSDMHHESSTQEDKNLIDTFYHNKRSIYEEIQKSYRQCRSYLQAAIIIPPLLITLFLLIGLVVISGR